MTIPSYGSHLPDPYICPENVGHALVAAAKEGNAREVQALIKCPDVDINHADRSRLDEPGILGSHTALFLASRYGHEEVGDVLLQHPEIDINHGSSYKRTPLFLAIGNGHLTIAKLLLNDNRTDVNTAGGSKSERYPSPLNMAIGNVRRKEGYMEVIKQLISHPEIDINKVSGRYGTPLFQACLMEEVEVVKILISHPQIDINKANSRTGMNPLLLTSKKGYAGVVQMLLTHQGVHVNQADRNGNSPLFLASKEGHVDVVKTLLADQRVDVNQAGPGKATPLFIATMRGNVEVVKTLLSDQRVDVHQPDERGFTPLFTASVVSSYRRLFDESLEIVKLLLADP